MRIVSVNAWGGAMFEPLAAWLPRCEADVLCLQEVTRTPALGGWTEFADGERTLPQRANLFDDVRALLSRHHAMFTASDAGPVRAPDGTTHRQDFGLATFVDERLSVVGCEASFVHGSFVEHRQWAVANRPRAAHAVRVFDRSGNRVVTVAHVHGLRDPQGKGDTPARKRQAERLAQLVTRVRAPAPPPASVPAPGDFTVVCGDFNVLPDSETFAILGGIGLRDLIRTADTRTSRYPRVVRHANYMLVSDVDAIRGFEILAEPEVSDHRALVLDL